MIITQSGTLIKLGLGDFEDDCEDSYSWATFDDYEQDCIVMQSTGLKDKNGELIYEGDIIKTKTSNPLQKNKGVIKWHTCYYSIDYVKLGKYEESGLSITNNTQDYVQLEVIGNIYENKDLLNA